MQSLALRTVLGVLVLSACSGDSGAPLAVEPPRELANIVLQQSGGSASRAGMLTIEAWVGVSLTDRHALFLRDLTSADKGVEIRIDATSPEAFGPGIEILTNGTDDMVGILSIGTSGGSGHRNSESRMLTKRAPLPGPDLAGATISHIIVRVIRSTVLVPGRDLNGDGDWVDFDFVLELQIFGRF